MKTALVTGGTVRLGKAIAARLRAEGWRVLTSSHRKDSGADIVADLSEPMGAVRLYADAMRLLNGRPPDALVNNAALFTGEPADVRAVNFESPKKLTTLMAGREDGVGAVVNILDAGVGDAISSGDSRSSSQAGCGYFESKRELRDFTRSAALMFAETLRVNGVAPGPVLAPTDVHEKAGEMLLAHRPAPDDVAAAVAYLLGAEATTGCVVPVDAGQLLLEE